MNDDLTTFLRARLDEDVQSQVPRAVSRAAGPINPRYAGGPYDPVRVIREIEAKRQIIDHAEQWAQTLNYTPDGWTEATATAYRMAMEWTLRQLALPYADHPDYRQEWRP